MVIDTDLTLKKGGDVNSESKNSAIKSLLPF